MRIFLATLFLSCSLFAKESFAPFTGQITGNKVRLRARPDLDSHIIKYLHKQDLLLVKGELGDFYVVAPPKEIKGYLYRAYIIDNIVDANKINIRLSPSAEAPIVGTLSKGAKIEGRIAPQNRKWMEIYSPSCMHLYVSKSYIQKMGGPEYLAIMEEKKERLQSLLSSSMKEAEQESKKDFSEMAIQPVIEKLEGIIQNYSDFPLQVIRAKEILAALKENYLNKKEEYLLSDVPFLQKKEPTTQKAAVIEKKDEEEKIIPIDIPEIVTETSELFYERPMTLAMQKWKGVEEDLFVSWKTFHPELSKEDFYAEQAINAETIDGKLAPFNHKVKNKPGDYLLLVNGAPIAYLYSTLVDLDKWLGRHVHLKVNPRPNHHFAFPAYFVVGVEEEAH